MRFAWEKAVTQAAFEWSTPFYLSAWNPVQSALDELRALEGALPIRHWLSFKTHPVAPLIRHWRDIGHSIEIVSEYEFLAALREGFRPDHILVNGVAKHNWITKHNVNGIRVHFDSLREVEQLLDQAKSCKWRVGVRCHVAEEYDPDDPQFVGQFGMHNDEAVASIRKLCKENLSIESIHFHLRSNVSSAVSYELAIDEVSRICQAAEFSPVYIDCGGGLPVPGECLIGSKEKYMGFDLQLFRYILGDVPLLLPSVREIWLENGRFITGRSAVFVTRVLDIKKRADSQYLICDGGRTNNALVSDWETHDIFTLPLREGPLTLTTICGPTCMAFDRLIRTELPENTEVGDLIVWMNAGAYHIPWETRFSHGLAKVVWCDENNALSLARNSEEALRHACEMTKPYYRHEYVSPEIAVQWWMKNPKAFIQITNSGGELCACFGVLALSKSFMEQFIKGNVSDTQLRTSDICSFSESKRANQLYISGVVVRDPSTHIGRKRATVMIWAMMIYVKKLYGLKRQRELFAVSITRESEQLMKNLGFQLACEGKERQDKCNTYKYILNHESWKKLILIVGDYSVMCKYDLSDPTAQEIQNSRQIVI